MHKHLVSNLSCSPLISRNPGPAHNVAFWYAYNAFLVTCGLHNLSKGHQVQISWSGLHVTGADQGFLICRCLKIPCLCHQSSLLCFFPSTLLVFSMHAYRSSYSVREKEKRIKSCACTCNIEMTHLKVKSWYLDICFCFLEKSRSNICYSVTRLEINTI